MARSKYKSVDDYIAAQPEAAQAVLRRVRDAIRTALPAAEEVISYQIPAYRLPGGEVVYFAGWKRHYSLYPASPALIAALSKDLEPYERSKGTIRFPLDAPIPVRLIQRFARFRAKEIAETARAKATRRSRGGTKRRAQK